MWLLPSGNDLREPDYIAEWQQSKTEVYEVGNQGSTEIYSGLFWQWAEGLIDPGCVLQGLA